MLSRLLYVSSAFVSLFLFAACSDTPSKPVAAPKPAAAAKSVAKTAGVLKLDGLPPESVSAAEVIIVSELSADARKRISRQRELFEYKITGQTEGGAAVSAIPDVAPADAVKLDAAMRALKGQFPAVLVMDVDLGNNRLRKFQSDSGLHQEYKYLFSSLKWDNLERGLKFISEKMETSNQEILAAGEKADDDGYRQAEANIAWLKSVRSYFAEYFALATDYHEAKDRYIDAQTVDQDPTDWDTYAAMYAHMLIMDTSEHILGSGFAAEDGSFEVKGHGIMIVRVELGVVSAYFLPGSGTEERVRIDDLRQF
ncbi:Unannotated [Lentimonas sp. CC4]|nr:Unannotated [Lentimonas sp. CC4]CAA6686489.1 Unannotated [Lentimonas sp. CC6]CAA7074765.1 Unannotated [Lentimonas sp. CC4]CAA7169390.1 Unannotated [Lentimonas sp. CC21]CAA7180216.1 Unannotated [Lentimonas sp. CC8]